MLDREEDLRCAPLVPGAVLALLFALVGSCDASRGVAAHALSGLSVLEAPWLFVATWALARNPPLLWVLSLPVLAIAGVVVRIAVPRRWTSPIGFVAGFAWALCSCASLA